MTKQKLLFCLLQIHKRRYYRYSNPFASSLSLTFVCFCHFDFSLQRLRRAAQRSSLPIVRSKKDTVDFDAPFFELGLDRPIVIVPVIRQNVVLGIDGNAVDGQSLNICQAHSDQIPTLEFFGQAVDEGFFADDGQPPARNGKHTIQMQHAFYKPNTFHLILIA